MKYRRHARILELIQNENIETQEELSDKLNQGGFDVTQATISRDIKELRLVKILTGNGRYKYAVSANESAAQNNATKYYNILKESVIKTDYAGNMVVVKCYVGMANAACAAIDSLSLGDIIGTIAGDDTIFMVVKNEERALFIMQELNKMIK